MRTFNTILVTGGLGFMGSAFIRYLLEKTSFTGKVLNVDAKTYAANEQSVLAIAQSPRYHFFCIDVQEKQKLEDLILSFSVDAIVHFAAETHVDRSIQDPRVFIETNVLGTLSLLEIVRKNPHIHMHQVSTDEVYGSLGEGGVFTEQSPFRPNSPYAASKASADHLVRSFMQTYNLSLTISHSCNNYGPFQYPEKFLPLILTKAIDKKPIPIYGKGVNVREWIYVEDHAKALYQILTQGRSKVSYNIGSGERKKNVDFLDLALQELSKQTNTALPTLLSLKTFVQDRKGHDFRYALNTSFLQKTLQYRPEYSLKEGMRKTVSQFLADRQKG